MTTHRKKVTARRKIHTTKKNVNKKHRVIKKVISKKNIIAKKRINKNESDSRKNELFLDTSFEFFNELKDLILKSSPTEKKELTQRINKLGRIKFAAISGIFLEKENPDPQAADLLVVCDDIDRSKFRTLLKSIEADVGKELKFALMDKDEFMYRFNMFDRFIRVLFEGSHEILIDRIGIDI